jgi:hypothetical protein
MIEGIDTLFSTCHPCIPFYPLPYAAFVRRARSSVDPKQTAGRSGQVVAGIAGQCRTSSAKLYPPLRAFGSSR